MLKISLLAEELVASTEKPYCSKTACLAKPCATTLHTLRIWKFPIKNSPSDRNASASNSICKDASIFVGRIAQSA